MPLERNPLDKLADELASWADVVSSQIADSLMGGFAAPGAARLSEQQKMDYYTRQLFEPDGSPNMAGRTQEMDRLGPEMFAEVFAEVSKAHPEWVQQPPEEQPFQPGFRVPTDVPGVTEISDQPERLRPTHVPGVSEVVGGAVPPAGVLVRAMATGGIVTEPTIALIGEAGPEAVVPLTPGAPTVPVSSMPQGTEIQQYIVQAARQRGIDPEVALAVAYHEGGRDPKQPNQPVFSDPAVRGTFNTGSSWWPFQLHYGGKGYEQFGTEAGMGNEFTAATGWQPGDPRAWRAATDFALDEVLRSGWSKWYGRLPAQVSVWQGVPTTTGRA